MNFSELDIITLYKLRKNILNEEELFDDLKKIVEKLREIVPSNIIIETTEVAGFAADEIVDLAKESNAGLIVLGAQTEGNLVEKLIGMVTTEVLRRASCPVLIVPQKAKFKEIKMQAIRTEALFKGRSLFFAKMRNGKKSICSRTSEKEKRRRGFPF